MKLFHHTDNDGLMSGSIIYNTFMNKEDWFLSLKNKDVQMYNYEEKFPIKYRDINYGETIFFVDLCIDDNICGAIITLIALYNCKIVYIDHHLKSVNTCNGIRNGDVSKTMFQQYVIDKRVSIEDLRKNISWLVTIGISGCMLSYVYSCMTEEERVDPMDVEYSLTDKRTELNIGSRKYNIPYMITLVDDNDVWIHDHKHTRYLSLGLLSSQLPVMMDNMTYTKADDMDHIRSIINIGETVAKYEDAMFTRLRGTGFESDVFPEGKCFVINSYVGNSMLFGDLITKYPFVCKFYYDGNQYVYTLYSNVETGIDVEKICSSLDGGGHVHAAGFRSNKNIFE